MNQRNRLKSLPVTGGGCTHIDIDVYYSKGGMNYFTSRSERRGLYVSVQPVTRSANTVSFTAFTGVKQFVKEMARFNQKALDEFVLDPETEETLISHVLRGGDLKLAETP